MAEADESDGSFLCLRPTYPVITNIDTDHLDYYENLDKVVDAFEKFMAGTQDKGCIFSCQDNKSLRKILRNLNRETLTFGLSRDSDVYAENVKLDAYNSQFDCIYRKKNLGRINLSIPGMHNIINALGAIAVALRLKVEFEIILRVLSGYLPVERRFQIKAKISDIMVVDDYAHHPTEIRSTLETAKIFKPRRIISVFQPHRYTRTQLLEKDFAEVFSLADKVVITDIYSATEDPIEGVSGKNIYERILDSGHKDVCFIAKEKILSYLMKDIKAGDVVLVMGAGDITDLASALVRKLKKLPS